MAAVTRQRVPLSIWIAASRPKTLPAAAAPVWMGATLAIADDAFHPLAALVALLGALLIQIGTNFSNDYADFLKGADTEARVGPLRVTQAGLVSPAMMRAATALVFGLAFALGMYLVARGGWPVLLLGVLSIVSGILYTTGRYSLAYLGLADLFVLVFFGPVAVGGTYYVQALRLPWEVPMLGLAPGMLSVGILLANNIRDLSQDRAAGKRTLVVRLGRRFGVGLYAACTIGAALLPAVWFVLIGERPWTLVTLVTLAPALANLRMLRRTPEGAALNPLLGRTARLLLLHSLLFGLGCLL